MFRKMINDFIRILHFQYFFVRMKIEFLFCFHQLSMDDDESVHDMLPQGGRSKVTVSVSKSMPKNKHSNLENSSVCLLFLHNVKGAFCKTELSFSQFIIFSSFRNAEQFFF